MRGDLRTRPAGRVAAKLRGSGVRHVVGNHGIEPGPDMSGFERDVDIVPAVLARALADATRRRDRGQALLAHGPLPARPPQARGTRRDRPCRRRVAASDARDLREARRERRPGRRPEQGRHPARAARRTSPRTSRSTSATMSRTRTCSRSTSRGGCCRCESARPPRSAARFYLRDQREIDRLLACLVKLRKDRGRDEA